MSLDERSGHAIAYVIQKQRNGQYTFMVVNTGEGIQNHLNKEGWLKNRYRPAYVIKNIHKDRICNPRFLADLAKYTYGASKLKNASDFYKQFLKQLGGEAERRENLDPVKDMITAQRSGSCTFSVLLALMRIFTPFKEYKKLIFQIKAQSIIHFYDVFKEHFKDDPVARELMQIALSNHKKRIPKIKKQIGEEAFNQLLSSEEKQKLAHIMCHVF